MKLMRFLQTKSKFQWLFPLLLCAFSIIHLQQKDGLSSIISSDGSGYYAYLPALFIYHDSSFEKTAEVERQVRKLDRQQHYLILDKEGEKYNKCFPGIALLQTPFFLLACFFAWIFGQTIDGYSDIFIYAFYLGSLFYTLAGFFLFNKVLNRLFPEFKMIISWLIPLFYLATPLVFYTIYTPSISHGYSFFLFALFAWLILKFKNDSSTKMVFFLGLTLGLIVLIRPTNILILLMVPFLLGSWVETRDFFKALFEQKAKKFVFGSMAFFIILLILFCTWKWQTGNWIIGAYHGEGFNFGNSLVFQSLFSFRIGLFLHTPLFLLTVLGIGVLFFHNLFKAIWFLFYFAVNVFVIAAWWCWDYESSFGARPYTELGIFLILPILELLRKRRKIVIVGFLFCALIGTNRLYAKMSGSFNNQRFTKENYFQSLNIWNKDNFDRWSFTRACTPFGKKIEEILILSNPGETMVHKTDLYANTVDFQFPKDRKNKRFYVSVSLDKRNFGQDWSDVYLVIDATSKDQKLRHYQTIPLFNDRFEARKSWVNYIFEEATDIDCLKQYDVIRIYIFNSGKQHFTLKNVAYKINVYENK